ncbi:MAG: methylated-DNA--[protein]-cysteine S-methyltransferase [Lapillicoccus sp.]
MTSHSSPDAAAAGFGAAVADAYPVTTADLAHLHARLAATAQRDHLLDVAYRTVDSPIGPLLIAATPAGLVRVAFEREGEDVVLQGLADRISPRVLQSPAQLDGVAHQLDEYFAGRRHRFELPLDWRLSTGFYGDVLHHLATDVGYGRTATYAALAGLAGRPRAVRAVGTACATNPLPVVVPCHRVVRSDGGMGAYRGGSEAKRALLDLEGGATMGG